MRIREQKTTRYVHFKHLYLKKYWEYASTILYLISKHVHKQYIEVSCNLEMVTH